MKKSILIFVISIFIGVCSISAQTYVDTQKYTTIQTENLFFIDYTIGFPSGNLADFLDKTSFRGFSMDFRHMMGENYSLGISAGFQSYYDDMGIQDHIIDNAILHGSTYHYVYSVPLYVTAHYYLSEGDKFIIYGGLGVGTIYNDREVQVGSISINDKDWHFAMIPELGVMYKVNDYMGAQIRGTADYGFKSGDADSIIAYRLHLGFYYNF